MRKFTYKFLIWTIALTFVAILFGCEKEQQQSTSPKKTKLIAAENIQLKKDLAARDAEIEKQKKLLANAKEENNQLKKSLSEKSNELMEALMASMDKDAQKIRIENQQLKKQIEELKKKLAEK